MAFRIVQLRPAAARGQITFAFGIVNPCRRRTFAHRGDPRASAFPYCPASAPSSLLPNHLPPRGASTPRGEEHLASRSLGWRYFAVARRTRAAFRRNYGASAFLLRFVSFSFQGTRPLLELASLQSCVEEPNSPEFTRRHRRKVAALKQLLCWFSSKNPASLHSLAGHKVATLVCFSVILPRNLTSSNSLASGRHRHKATVEPIGIEPMTSCVQSRRSPS